MSENLYYEIFMKQFVQTLAQLTAAALTTTLAVPLYNYYVKRSFVYTQNVEEDFENTEECDECDDVSEKSVEDDCEVVSEKDSQQ
jgi:hypothetical protein